MKCSECPYGKKGIKVDDVVQIVKRIQNRIPRLCHQNLMEPCYGELEYPFSGERLENLKEHFLVMQGDQWN